jgi:DNA replication protein DnaC
MSVTAACRELKLPTVGKNAERLSSEAVRQGMQPIDYLVELLNDEIDERRQRRSERRVKEACFPMTKTLEGFDFKRSPAVAEYVIRLLSEGGYIEHAEPVILLGEPGTGKTHLAIALGVEAARQGKWVRFTTAARLATELIEARDARDLERVVNRYSRVELLIVDELAYLPFGRTDAELLFQVLGERQERKPIIVTTNLPFSEWTTMFPDQRLCKALVDRLTHRAHIIETGIKSNRLEETLERIKNGYGKKQ